MSRSRLEAAFSPEVVRALTHRLADILGDHFAQVGSSAGKVLNWSPPSTSLPEALAWLDAPRSAAPDGASCDPHALAGDFAARVAAILDHGHNLHDPRYIGHQVPGSSPVAALFDAVGSATNQVMAIYEMSPWATAVERAMIQRLGDVFGLIPGRYAGLVTHGGTLANLTSLLTARNVTLGDAWERGLPRSGPAPVLVAHADAHYGIARAAGILGLGTEQVIRAPLDDHRRMDPESLDTLLRGLASEGRPVIAVVACACATPTGAFDELSRIADICERQKVWLHVDAAHGGAAAFSPRYRPLVEGLSRADSFICDAHKMLFVPALCAFVFYRNPAHRFEAFRQNAPYLFDPSAPGMAEYDSGLMTMECTKRAAAYGLWGLWSMFGPQLFTDLVETTFDMGRVFYELLRAAPDFEPLHEPQCNIVCFRYLPTHLQGAEEATIADVNRRIRRALIESGEFYITQTNIGGQGALRTTIMNPFTTAAHLDGLLNAIRHIDATLPP